MTNNDTIQKWAAILTQGPKVTLVADGLTIMGGPHPYFPICGQVAAGVPEGEAMAKLWAGSMEMFRALAAIRAVCREAVAASPEDRVALLPMLIAQVGASLPLPTLGETQSGFVEPDDPEPAPEYADMASMAEGFMLRWRADMRAIARWQLATGKTMTWPDHADLCVWLMERLDAQDLSAGARAKSPGRMLFLELGSDPDGWDVDGDGGGAPGYFLLWKAIQVWAVCQNRADVTIGEAAAVFNLPLSMVAEAITLTDSPFMFLNGPPDDPNTTIEHDGE